MEQTDPAAQPTRPIDRDTQIDRGREARRRVPRHVHADWQSPVGRPDPVDTLVAQNEVRSADLVPVLFHDADLARVAGRPECVHGITWGSGGNTRYASPNSAVNISNS